MSADRKFTIGIETTANTAGAEDAAEAIDQVSAAANEASGSVNTVDAGNLDRLKSEIADAGQAMRNLIGWTKDEQDELRELEKLVNLSEASVASQQKGLDPSNSGSVKGLQASKETLAADKAEVQALREKVAARLADAKAIETQAAETKRLAAEAKELAAAERAREKAAVETRRSEEQALDVRRIKYNQIAQAVGFATQQFSGAAAQIREIAKASEGVDKNTADKLNLVANGFDSIQSSVQGAATGFPAGGPFGAILGGIVGLAAPGLKSELDALVKSLDGLADSKAVSAALPGRIEAVKKALLVEKAVESWGNLRKAISDTVDEATNAQAIAKIQRDLEQFKADEAVRVARSTGADEGTVKAAEDRAEEVRRNNAGVQANADSAAAFNKLNEAVSAHQVAQALASQAAQLGAVNQKDLAAEAKRLEGELATARRAYELSRAQAGADQEKNQIGRQNDGLISSGNNPDQRDAEQQIADKTRQLTDEIAAEIPESAKPAVEEIKTRLQNLLKDGQQQGENAQVEELLTQLAQKLERNNTGNREIFAKISANTDAAIEAMRGLKSQIDEQGLAIRTLRENARNRGGF